ncbi:MAG: 2OG-Fe(II) oxygenase [bacterium]|jgi:predicted 2-oxoglutarate/Fe(II)-dependent dioxygenase YbiX|nr:2OG-Fe(II) oxygenase [bacterium]
MNSPTCIGVGERAPDFVLPVYDGTPSRFYSRAGGAPTVLIFAPDTTEKMRSYIEALQRLTPPLDIFIVQSQQIASDPVVPTYADTSGQVCQAYRIRPADQTLSLVLDPNLRILSTHLLTDFAQALEEISQTLGKQPHPYPQEITAQAPVLLIPRVLTAEICDVLITVWQTQGNEETGVEQSIAKHRENVIDHTHKKRRDHVVTDEKLMRLLSTTIGRRVMPELRKAFHFEATRFEGFKIVCYDAEDHGFFHAHRDNLSPSTAHRRFALTLNLNAGYEGGHLTFPEYSPHLYKPDPGAAVLFSCSHLHAVTPVKVGKRFALLSFLFGETDVRSP